MTRDKLASMIIAYRDGDIATDDAAHLAGLIRQRGDESHMVLSDLETEGLIAQALDSTDDRAFLRSFWERHRAERDSDHFVHDFQEKRASAPTGRARRWWMAATAATAAIVLLFAALTHWTRPGTGGFAQLEQVRGEVFVIHDGAELAINSGQELAAGDGFRVTGEESSATLVFVDGTRLEFGEDTLVTSVTEDKAMGKRVELAEGFFTAQVAKQPAGRPMILATPNSEVVVLGTTFSLSVGTEVTHLETQSGNVRLMRTSDGRSVQVPAGFNAIVASADEPLVAQPFTPRSGASRLQLEGCWNGALSPQADAIAATRYVKGDVEIWNVASGQRHSAFRAHDKRVTAAAFTPDGQALVTGSLDGSLKWWDRKTGELRAAISPRVGEITELRPSKDGRMLTVLSHEEGGEFRTITSWDLSTRQQRWSPKQFLADRLAFSPDGSMLAFARKQDRFVTLWDLRSGEEKTVLRESGDRKSGLLRNVLSMAFSHDGRTLAVDDVSGIVSFWDLATGEVGARFKRHGGRIFGMSFSPDDRFLATGQQDDTIRIWDIATATPVAAFAGHSHTQVRDVTFSSDGTTLLTRGIRLATLERPRDGILQLWTLPDSLIQPKPR